MSLSEDEDDFLSADEDNFGDDDNQDQTTEMVEDQAKLQQSSSTEVKQVSTDSSAKLGKNIQEKDQKDDNKSKIKDEEEHIIKKKDVVSKDAVDEDDEEALAERIRERNLKLARKFSQEIAKNVKASAPIPVKASTPIDYKSNYDTEEPSTPESETKSGLPPAPPPTPALSSSFTSDELTAGATITASPVSSGTQYGWRVPAKASTQQSEPTFSPPDSKSAQTRLALDRLSKRLSQTDKNLFEMVAEDIKKVSLKPKDPKIVDPTQADAGASIPLISDLSSALGGWKWNSATKLIASSASQVTSLTGSVIDSVVNVTHIQPQQTSKDDGRQISSAETTTSSSKQDREHPTDQSSQSRGSTNDNSSDPNDGLVDFTLNAMESLGKRAFGVMTERNESGSLQIKGLGRPWEHLLKPLQSSQEDESHSVVSTSSINSSKKND